MNVKDKLASFAKTASSEAKTKSGTIESEIEERYTRECERIYSEAMKEAKEQIEEENQKLDNMQSKDINESVRNAKFSIIDMRNQLMTELFKNIVFRLAAYAETEEYFQRLVKDMKEIFEKYGEVEFFLCARDMFLKEKILADLEGANISQAGTDILGGFKARIKSENVLVDYSFLSRLEDERENFRGFKIL